MKNCPNCNAEMEDHFELCWNCNYSLSEEKVIEMEEMYNQKKKIDCLRCNVKMIYSGAYKFHEGPRIGFFGNIFEAFVNTETFDLYVCPKCGKVEHFIPTPG